MLEKAKEGHIGDRRGGGRTKGCPVFCEIEVNYYDLILMDIQMPKMDGFEATRKIRAMERPDAAAVPIFAMIANAFAEDEEKSLEAGMNAHLPSLLKFPPCLLR